VIQGQPIVAIVGGVVCVLQRSFGRHELVVRVLVGPDGPRGVNRTLRLLHFLVRGFGTRSREEDEQEKGTPTRPTHVVSI